MARVRVREVSDDEIVEQPAVTQVSRAKRPKKPNRKILVAGVAIVFTLVVILALINDRNRLSRELEQASSAKNTQVAQPTDEAADLKQELSKFIEVPDETPTLFTVSDAAAVRANNQSTFFLNAQDGDKVLIFAKSNKAILYRPSAKKIIDVASIDLSNTGGQ